MNKRDMFKDKLSIGIIDSKLVCLLYKVDRVSKRPVKVDVYSIRYYFKLLFSKIFFNGR